MSRNRGIWRRWAINEVFLIIGNRPASGSVMMKRRRLIQTPLFGIYLHTHEREDTYRALHDHPWNFTTLILRGYYTEKHYRPKSEVLDEAEYRTWRRFSIHHMNANKDAHVITEVEPKTISLLLAGRKRREWGFYTPKGWTPWTDYREA